VILLSEKAMSIKFTSVLVLLVVISALPACSQRSETPQPSAQTSATAPVSESDDVSRFTLGSFSAMALRDGALALPNDNQVFGVGRTPAEVAELLAAADLPEDKLHLSIQPLLVKAADRVFLFDTGGGAGMGASGGRLAASLDAAGVDPRSITDVFISHAHFDHIGGLRDSQGVLAFPDAAIHMSSPEWTFLKEMKPETAAAFGIKDHAALVAAVTGRMVAFEPGAEVVPGVVEAVEIRGHTPGHSGFRIRSGPDSLLYVGDAVHHFVVSVQKPDWTIAFDLDAPTAEASRSELLTRSAASGQRIYAVHFPFPGVGKVERRADRFVWVAEQR
jgi:glyoxylase-like metal-dependent hydrolase (beta-lactamase superfamily II)